MNQSNKNEQPLSGKTIVITRAQEQQSEVKALLKNLGARVLDLPALIIGEPSDWEPLDTALAELNNFHWMIFSSANGVKAVENRLQLSGTSLSRHPKTLKIAAVGRKTAHLLNNLDTDVDFIPPNFVADSLIKHFPVSGFGLRILLPRVETGGRTLIAEAFRQAGAFVLEVPAYESSCPQNIPLSTAKAFLNGEVDAIAFTSGKTAIHTAQLLKKNLHGESIKHLSRIKIISIGPQTSLSCKKYFNKIDQEADPHDVEGLVQACVKAINQ